MAISGPEVAGGRESRIFGDFPTRLAYVTVDEAGPIKAVLTYYEYCIFNHQGCSDVQLFHEKGIVDSNFQYICGHLLPGFDKTTKGRN